MIRTLAAMEWKRLFRSPLGWAVLAAAQLGQGLVFVQLVQAYQRNPAAAAHNGATYQIASLALASSAYIALLAIPIISMPLISEERIWCCIATAEEPVDLGGRPATTQP